MKKLALLVTLFALSCGDNKGEDCFNDSECDDGLICATYAACPGGNCAGICATECDSDSDCEDDGEICRDEASSDRHYCVFDQLSE